MSFVDWISSVIFQSTPPCGGDDTRLLCRIRLFDFNPRPLAGATHVQAEHQQRRDHFNPRPLAGATFTGNIVHHAHNISIHAPLRGRLFALVLLFEYSDFNPRPLAGATWPDQSHRTLHSFQSTPPCGGDPFPTAFCLLSRDFNPRPLAGATRTTTSSFRLIFDFNPRPLAGATQFIEIGVHGINISIHAPLRGRPLSRKCQS